MSTHSTLIRWGLAAALLLGGPAMAAPISAADIDRRLQDPKTAEVFRKYNASHAEQIQDAIRFIYQKDPAYLADAKKDGKPLDDSIVGPITLSWIRRFCDDYHILATDPDFGNQVVSSLAHVAALAKAHPDWSAVLQSDGFDSWINGQGEQKQAAIYKIRRSGAPSQVNALIDEYAKSNAPVAAKAPKEGGSLRTSYRIDPGAVGLQSERKELADKLKKRVVGPYQSQRSFDDAVIAAANGSELDAATMAAIRQRARSIGYQLTAEGRELLRAENAPAALLAKLEPMAELAPVAKREAFVEVLKKTAGADLGDFQDRAVDASYVAVYEMTKDGLAELVNAKLPAVVIGMLIDLVNIEYPTEPLLESAIRWKVRHAVGLCPANMNKSRRRLDDTQLADLKPILVKDPEVFAKLAPLRAVKGSCSDSQRGEARVLDEKVGDAVMDLLRHQMSFAHDNPKPAASAVTDWSVNSCACLRATLAGQVYGFYPYWLKGREHTINFGELSRIGFYGLTFDENGQLTDSPGTKDWPADLLVAAQKYRTRVDWVIHKSDWSDWTGRSATEKRSRLDRLIDSITAVLSRPLRDTVSVVTPIVSLGAVGRPTNGDGVTIFFDGMPETDAAIFREFIVKLAARVQSLQSNKGDEERALNIMTTHSAMNKLDADAFSYVQLSKLITAVNAVDPEASIAEQTKQKKLDLHVLVLIAEPTSDAKKMLRLQIENALHGEERMRLLRDVIPVVVYDNVNWEQLNDDIIYFKDNFAGVGFWPLPLAAAVAPKDGAKSVDQMLRDSYQDSDAGVQDGICEWVCPNRIVFRGIWLVVTLGAIVSGAWIGLYCCMCRTKVLANYFYLVPLVVLWVAPLPLALLLLVCDPLLKKLSNGNVPVVLVSVGFVGGILGWIFYNRMQRDKP